MLLQMKKKELESELVQPYRTDNHRPRAYRRVPLYSDTLPLVGMLGTCDDEPLPDYMPNNENVTNLERTIDKGDLLVHPSKCSSNNLYKLIKNQNILVLKTQRALMESQRVRENRELEHISHVIAKQNDQEVVEAKRRQQIHEASFALRDLEVQLHKARITLNLEAQKGQYQKLQKEERKHGIQEAVETRARTENEIRKEIELSHKKRREFRTELLSQIAERHTENSADRRQAEADRKYMVQLQKDMKIEEAEEKRLNTERKVALKKEMDKFLNIQNSLKRAQKPPPDVNDLGILESCLEPTAKSRRAVLEERDRKIRQRIELSNIVGRHLQEIDQIRNKRAELITDLLIKEHEAKCDADAKTQIEARYKQERNVKNDLMQQRFENRCRHIVEQQNERFSQLSSHPTSFNQRQYRYQDDYSAHVQANRNDCCKASLEMISEKRERKIADNNFDKANAAARQQAQIEHDQAIANERHLILSHEPVQVLSSLKNGILTKDEMIRYGVPKRLPQKLTPIK